jgi:hypothetical protein
MTRTQQRWYQAGLIIGLFLLSLFSMACFSPTAPTPPPKPFMILNPDLQGIA